MQTHKAVWQGRVLALLGALMMTAITTSAAGDHAAKPFCKGELIFPLNPKHNHGSCVVECPNGDLLACWYRGSGERTADDVQVLGARLKKGQAAWTAPFVMADTPGFPDTNPCMVIDPQRRLWLFWATILNNQWESALMKVKISRDYQRDPGPPRWESEQVMHLKPGPEFLETVERDLDAQWQPTMQTANAEQQAKLRAYLAERHQKAADKLSTRLGWMTRAHPFILNGKRLIVPLYSDLFDFSLMALTDDWGATWQVSRPLVGPGNVQPSIVQRRDGTLVAYFRDNGPPPQRAMESESHDDGLTWTLAHDTQLPDPGAGLEAIVLKSGRWLLVNNNTENGRYRLAVSVSEDEGRTWPLVRYLDRDDPGPGAGSYCYPSIIQAHDGTIHVTYSYAPNATTIAREGKGETIKHVQFNEAWLLEGHAAP